MKLPHKSFALMCAGALLAAGSLLNVAPAEAAGASSAVVLTNGTPPAGAIVVSAQTQAALQTALDQAGAKGTPSNKGVVWIPAGTYVISGSLIIPSNTKIVADSGATIRGSHLIAYSDIDGSTGYNGPHDIEIIGGTWDGGARSGQSTSNNMAFMMRHGKNITFDGVTVTNCVNHFINASASTNVVVKNSTFKDQVRASSNDKEFWQDSDYGEESVKVTEVIHLDFADNGENNIDKKDGTPAGKVLVENNTFENILSAVGSHRLISSLKNGAHKSTVGGLTVRGNTFNNVSGHVITLASMDNAVIENNTLSGTPSSFVFARDAKNAKLSGNGRISSILVQDGSSVSLGSGHTLYHASDVAAHVDGKSHLDITGCTINNSVYGISINNESTASISGCTFNGVKEGAIVLNGSGKGTTVAGNRIEKGGSKYGIRASNGANAIIQNNVVVSQEKYGILVQGAGAVQILDNQVIDSVDHGILVEKTPGTQVLRNTSSSTINVTSKYEIGVQGSSDNSRVENNKLGPRQFAVWQSPGATNINNVKVGAQSAPAPVEQKCSGKQVFRLYNAGIGGKHHYTLDQNEKDALVAKYGWKYEGVAWCAPKDGQEVYRLYNPASSAHHYTMDVNEKNALTSKHGWKYEGVAWFSDKNKGVELRRVYNRNLPQPAQHHYTADMNEWKALIDKHGWVAEGIAWYGEKPVQ